MAYEIGTAIGSALNNDTSGHKVLLNAIRTFVETTLPIAERWIPVRTLNNTLGTVVSLAFSGTTATITMGSDPLLSVGDFVSVTGASDAYFNGYFVVTASNPNDLTFTYTMIGTPASAGMGSVTANRGCWESIWKAPGLSGDDEIFMGIKTYQSPTSDYYNFKVMVCTGYIANNTFETQAGSSPIMGVCLWNQNIPYWFVGNGQKLIVVAKVENVYESFYIGKYLPYATPSQYPYPVCVGANLSSASATRYSDTARFSWFKGAIGSATTLVLRSAGGTYKTPDVFPFYQGTTLGTDTSTYTWTTRQLRNTASLSITADGYYGLHSLVMSTNEPNVFGELEGIYYISGFNNAVENTIIWEGITYVVLRDVLRTGFNDYVAIRLQ